MILLDQVRSIIPSLNNQLHKGQSGKIGIIGGSKEYTGAPYYVGYSSLKTGVDISHVFCTKSAGTAIKSYTPELIVHPLLRSIEDFHDNESIEEAKIKIVNSVVEWFPSFHVLVVGPGLGRDQFVQKCTKDILLKAKDARMPLIVDGDGLFLVSLDPSIIKGYPLTILTPNVVEFNRLCETMKIDIKQKNSQDQLSQSLGNVIIIMKGITDKITNGEQTIECNEEGSPRRCGGQGDLLAGVLAAFVSWTTLYSRNESKPSPLSPLLLASYGACFVSRKSSKTAFLKHFRSTTTPNIIEEIGPVFQKYFPVVN
jgi:ATP-dependent NAD(P)H-hydrate dehydratase